MWGGGVCWGGGGGCVGRDVDAGESRFSGSCLGVGVVVGVVWGRGSCVLGRGGGV